MFTLSDRVFIRKNKKEEFSLILNVASQQMSSEESNTISSETLEQQLYLKDGFTSSSSDNEGSNQTESEPEQLSAVVENDVRLHAQRMKGRRQTFSLRTESAPHIPVAKKEVPLESPAPQSKISAWVSSALNWLVADDYVPAVQQQFAKTAPTPNLRASAPQLPIAARPTVTDEEEDFVPFEKTKNFTTLSKVSVPGRECYSAYSLAYMQTWCLLEAHNQVKRRHRKRCNAAFGIESARGHSWTEQPEQEEIGH